MQTRLIRIHLRNGSVIEREYIGLSAAVAEYPQAWRVEFAAEADRRAGGSY